MNPLSAVLYMLALIFMLYALLLAQIGELNGLAGAQGMFVPCFLFILAGFIVDAFIWTSERDE